jgi:gliding motility-associated-like protein
MDFDPSDKEVILSANYFRDLFVQKTSRDGQLVWVKKIGGQTEMGVADIALGPEENIFICGSFNKVADFDPSNDSLMVVAKGGEDGFIEKLDRNGNIIWAIFLENTKRTHVSGIAVFKEIIYACGEISDETDFDPTENRNIVKALGERDAFTLKLSQCISNASLDENICVGDSLFFNQHFILKEGTFRDTFANLKGCDSLVVLQVCVVPHQKYYDTTTTCDSFLWLDNITYYSDTSLIYVAKTTNGCDSTIYLNLTIENCSFNVFIPNAFSPNSDGLNDRFKPVGERIESYEISIYTRWGELIYKSGDSNGWDGADAHSGLYMYDILLIGNDDKETIKRRESGVVHLLK